MELNVRDDFPVLKRLIAGRPVVYLDSAATSLKPHAVLAKEREYSTWFTANVHRGKHKLSEEASDAYEAARSTIARYLSVPSSAVVFVKNATEAINTVANGLGLRPDDKVMLTTAEHHSNILPWMRHSSLAWISQNPVEPLDPLLIGQALERERPKVLALSCVSNVTGVVNPIREICRLARDLGTLTCIDASQAIPHAEIDVGNLGCDYLAFSGHKMLGPAGIGILTGRLEALDRLSPLILGGGCVESVTTTGYTLRRLPYRLEAGTPNISGAIGLAAAVDYLRSVGYQNISGHERRLGDHLEQVASSVDGTIPVMAREYPRVAMCSLAFSSPHVTADQIAVWLSDNYGILARSGSFCAHPLVDGLGQSRGMLRISLYLYNNENDIDLFGEALSVTLRRMAGWSGRTS
ncbi:aminotransferase class V-fold PLP-dependent enzyme [Rhizobium laguerreae]|uniref:aminotransferase class V-fold PLP-dependent enzyme n=1 Tax=Rhizobium laguerreae TaxID=1076926 RepID=UPI001C9176F6|nr:cysteine desulfurase [Rhizobium laguerreae]MBY3119497.1 cysteine desulfurase [Rhizobium laguerreae]MBY3131669.1 cysteine desulfurase [Rhizobium laguerreae]MBY3346718.1 cysteine desulfurase [Rhizobium laguerreae]MBY3353680.1 cysteine desulfurase [Rhizobium laguerreae]MBY3374725.1 cysteine desulfurase [Rhizobium laguerreae]